MLSAEEIEESLCFNHELRGIELKGPGNRRDLAFFVKVARAALGLGNLRDGGHIVIGIGDENPAELMPGLDQEQLDSWLAYDDVARGLSAYADPPLSFEISEAELSTGVKVIVMEVAEFADLPHICIKTYDGKLRRGAIYVRPRKVPETSEIASHVEMRELIHLAVEKELRSFIATTERAGLELREAGASEGSSEAEMFDAERKDAWG